MKFLEGIFTNIPSGKRTFAIHSFNWIVILLFVHLYAMRRGADFNAMSLIPNFISMAVFYINYYFLIAKFVYRREIAQYIICNIIVFIASYFMILWIEPYITPISSTGFFRYTLIGQIFSSVFIIATALAIKMTVHWMNTQKRVSESERMRLEMELASLKNQLNPHFLINSLNNIYALISFEPKIAQASLLSVCSLLRYQLYDSDYKKVELEKEILFLKDYCNLMKLRLGNEVKVSVNLPENGGGIKIAPLLFISLVENAFKHGVDGDKESYIYIEMAIVGDVVRFTCRNSNFPKTTKDRSGSGIGVVNLQRRLELIYPHSHSYDVKIVGSVYIATLIINTIEND